MMLAGGFLLFRRTRQVVDYEPGRLWFWPVVAMAVTGLVVFISSAQLSSLAIWPQAFAKLALITLCYGGILLLFERDQLLVGWRMIWGLVRRRK